MRHITSFTSLLILGTLAGSTAQGAAFCPAADALLLGQNNTLAATWDRDLPKLEGDILPLLKTLNTKLKASGTTMIYVPTPSRLYIFNDEFAKTDPTLIAWKAEYKKTWDTTLAQVRSTGIVVVDTLDAFTPKNYYAVDHHWNVSGSAIGARLVSSKILELVKAQGEPLTTRPITVTENRAVKFEGSYARTAREKCNQNLTLETAVEPLLNDADVGLLDDVTEADVVVVGDSMGKGKPDNGFAPQLALQLQSDVSNYSMSGTPSLVSLAFYLNSLDRPQEFRPRFLVVPSFGLLRTGFRPYDIRAVIPAVQKTCVNGQPVRPGSPVGAAVTPSSYLAVRTASNVKKLSATLTYEAGKETFTIDSPSVYAWTGRTDTFSLKLNEAMGPLKTVDLQSPELTPFAGTVTLCR